MGAEAAAGRGQRVVAARAARGQPLAAVGAVLPVLGYLSLTGLALPKELLEHLESVPVSCLGDRGTALTGPAA